MVDTEIAGPRVPLGGCPHVPQAQVVYDRVQGRGRPPGDRFRPYHRRGRPRPRIEREPARTVGRRRTTPHRRRRYSRRSATQCRGTYRAGQAAQAGLRAGERHSVRRKKRPRTSRHINKSRALRVDVHGVRELRHSLRWRACSRCRRPASTSIKGAGYQHYWENVSSDGQIWK